MLEPMRRKPRKLTRFLCQEMLYDYMTGHLDSDRKKAVEDFLAENPEVQAELKAMGEAVRYCQQLSGTRLSDELIESLSRVRLVSEVVGEKVAYRNWPDLLKWSTEATIISVCVAGLAMVVPWQTIRTIFEKPPSDQVVLANVDKKISEKDVKVPPAPPAPEEKEEATVPPQTAAPSPTPTAAPVKVIVAQTQPEKPRPGQRPQPKGLLYRIMMNHPNIKEEAPALRDKILQMGGKKAGQVEIGWRKSNGNYFHFSLPEKEYQNLITTLGAYGPVRIYKSPHERVMPAGQIRIILWIEDARGSDATKASTTEDTGESTESTDSGEATATESTDITVPAAPAEGASQDEQ